MVFYTNPYVKNQFIFMYYMTNPAILKRDDLTGLNIPE